MFEKIVMLDKSTRLVISALNESYVQMDLERKSISDKVETWFNKSQMVFFKDTVEEIVDALLWAEGQCDKKEKLRYDQQQDMFPRDYDMSGDPEC